MCLIQLLQRFRGFVFEHNQVFINVLSTKSSRNICVLFFICLLQITLFCLRIEKKHQQLNSGFNRNNVSYVSNI